MPNGRAALDAYDTHAPDVMVMDLNMPGMSGIEATRELLERHPSARVLVLTVSTEEADVTEAIFAGATGYVLKDAPIEEVVAGIRAAANGQSVISPRIATHVLRRIHEEVRGNTVRAGIGLSDREVEVLTMLAGRLRQPRDRRRPCTSARAPCATTSRASSTSSRSTTECRRPFAPSARAWCSAVALVDERRFAPAGHPRTPARTAVLVAAGIAVALSVLVEAVDLDPSLGSRRFHASLETADALVLVFVAALLVGRLRSDASRRNLLLFFAIVVLAVKNLVHAGATMVIEDIPGGHLVVWGTALNGFLGAVLLATAAVLPDRPLRRRPPMAAVLAFAVVLVVGVLLLAGALEPLLPEAFKQLPEEATELELLSGHPVKIVVDLATALAYATAAVWFSRVADRNGDEFMKWLSIAAVVAAIAFVNYASFPSRFTQLLYGGEILWLGAILMLLVGAVREISNTEAELIRAAVLSERRRVARDLHDGVAQELAYIASQTSWFLHQPPDRQNLNMIRVGVERALEESRAAIAALTRPLNEPLDAALGHAAIDVGDRLGVRVELDLDHEVDVPPEWRDALNRIAREAVSNAARHGGARNVSLHLRNGEHVSLRVVDNGSGFDPEAPRSAQSFGLTGMRERAESLGGEFTLESRPGAGHLSRGSPAVIVALVARVRGPVRGLPPHRPRRWVPRAR